MGRDGESEVGAGAGAMAAGGGGAGRAGGGGGALRVEVGARSGPVAALGVPLAGSGREAGAAWLREHCPRLELWHGPPGSREGGEAMVIGRGREGAQSRVEYVADSREAAGVGSSATRLVVAVVDRAGGKVSLVPCAGDGQLLRLRARVAGPGGASGATEVGPAGTEDALELARKRRRELTMTYGSQRSKRILKRIEKNRIDPNRVVQREALGVTIGQAVKEQAEEGADVVGLVGLAEKDRTDHLPPHDLEATRPEAAYPLRRLAGPTALQALAEQTSLFLRILDPGCEAREALSGELMDLGAPHQVVELAQLAAVKQEGRAGAALTADGRTNRAEALALLSVALPLAAAFNKGKGRLSGESVEKIGEALKIPRLPLEIMLAKFAEPVKRAKGKVSFSRSAEQSLLFRNSLLVLALAAHNYDIKLDDLTALLGRKVPAAQLKALGCAGSGPGRFRLLLAKAAKEEAGAAPATLLSSLPKIKTQRAPARAGTRK